MTVNRNKPPRPCKNCFGIVRSQEQKWAGVGEWKASLAVGLSAHWTELHLHLPHWQRVLRPGLALLSSLWLWFISDPFPVYVSTGSHLATIPAPWTHRCAVSVVQLLNQLCWCCLKRTSSIPALLLHRHVLTVCVEEVPHLMSASVSLPASIDNHMQLRI